MTSFILAIDEGTTNAKAVLVNEVGVIVATGSCTLTVSHPQPGWSEQDPNEILAAVRTACKQALAQVAGVMPRAIAISNQRESVMVWDRHTGEALTPVAIWQCRRSEPLCEQIKDAADVEYIRHATGLPIDPLFSALKIRWLLESLENGQQRATNGELCAGTIDAWLAWSLTGGKRFVTDVSNASRTQLFNIREQVWDERLCRLFGVPRACLPEVLPSCAERGETAGFDGIPDGVPLLSQVGDSHAALYGQGGYSGAVVKATYGTGSSLMMPLQHESQPDPRLASTVAWHDGRLAFALEGNITHSGAAVSYMASLLRTDSIDSLASMAASLPDNGGVYFVPALSGLGAPHWRSRARGLITGLSSGSGPEHLARAAVEAVAYQIADVFAAMESVAGGSLVELLVDGGATRNRWLMQFQANLMKRPVVRSLQPDVSALGAAYLAGRALGWWKTYVDLDVLQHDTERFEPVGDNTKFQDCYQQWHAAIKRTVLDT